jgi:putative chitinase
MNYSPGGLRATWPSRFSQADAERMGRLKDPFGKTVQEADQRAIAERAYGGRMGNGPEGSGDGFAFRGRGLIQLTGRDAYSIAADALGLPLVSRPEVAAEPGAAAEIAGWTWAAWKGCNSLADAGDVEGWRRRVNGGLIGLDDCRARYRAVMEAMRWT